MVIKENQIFNLMDTNGRRNDVVNALQIYLKILKEVYLELGNTGWKAYPESLCQYLFYKKAIACSPEVFKTHKNYDTFEELLSRHNAENHFWELNMEKVRESGVDFSRLLDILDKDIESRARHYTSNLVKMGFTDGERNITMVGDYALHNKELERDAVEQLLPVDNINLLYLRQLMKLRIFADDRQRYYSPMWMAFYVLLHYDQVTEEDFAALVQGMSPCHPAENVKNLVETFMNGERAFMKGDEKIPLIFRQKGRLSGEILRTYFTNRKSKAAQEIYIEFYECLYTFREEKEEESFGKLMECYRENKAMLNKAFGYGEALFQLQRGDFRDLDSFLEEHQGVDLLEEDQNINEVLIHRFLVSKKLDSIREYYDTTKRLLRVTGIIRFKNGIVELAYRDLFEILFEETALEARVFGRAEKGASYTEYEGDWNSYFCTHHSILDILQYEASETQRILDRLNRRFGTRDALELSQKLSGEKQEKFKQYIKEKYPKNVVLDILYLFSDRKNDKKIKEQVNKDATVPTIYEYMVAIAWYYFSNEDFDILNSLNLSLNADFEPETHAGPGAGDIVIEYADRVVMLEATLMNKQAQKRGEWEPVLRHSINLKIEKEPKDVMTFFIADELDANTVNIWRAVSAVPLYSSADQTRRTANVTIMPLENKDLIRFIREKRDVRNLIQSTKDSYGSISGEFDMEWREKILLSVGY